MKPLLKRLESRGRDGAACALGLALRPRRSTPEAIRQGLESGRIKKVLMVRPYQGLGDLFCATPVISNLKADFPGLAKVLGHFNGKQASDAMLAPLFTFLKATRVVTVRVPTG